MTSGHGAVTPRGASDTYWTCITIHNPPARQSNKMYVCTCAGVLKMRRPFLAPWLVAAKQCGLKTAVNENA